MGIKMFLLSLIVTLVGGQYTSTDYQQCLANLACSINYEKTFQDKLNNLGYHTTLQLQTVKQNLDSKIDPLTQEIEILKKNASAIQEDTARELQNVARTLGHDKAFLHNLSVGVFELANEIHQEQHVRFQDVRKLIEEMNLVKQALGLSTNMTDLFNNASCEAQLNATMHNATFYESQYKQVLNMYKNLQTTVTDIRRQQRDLLTQLREKMHEISRLQKVSTNAPPISGQTRSTKCGYALGMEDRSILDSAITSSQSFGSFNAVNARLNDGGGWYTSARTTSRDWIQVDLRSTHVLTGLATQGAPCCEVWVSNFTILYSNDSQHWHEYHPGCNLKYIEGNKDQTSIKFHLLDPPIVAKKVRINVVDFHKQIGSSTNYIGMRMELFGCPLSKPKITQPTQ